MYSDLLGSVFASIRRQKGRSILLITAVGLCMGCLLVMMALGVGGNAQFLQSISGNDATEIRVSAGGKGSPGQTLDADAIAAFQSIDGVDAATGVITLPLRIVAGRYEAQNIEAEALDPSALRGRLAPEAGEMFSAEAAIPQIVLGYGAQMAFVNSRAAQQTQNPDLGGQPGAAPTPPPVGWLSQSIELSISDGGQGDDGSDTAAQNRTYSARISGILPQDKSDRNMQALMSLSAAQKMIRENYDLAASLNLKANSYTSALVFAKDIKSVKDILGKIDAMGYDAQSAVADLDTLQEQLGLQQTLLTVFEVFSVLAACMLAAFILLPGPGRRTQGAPAPAAARGTYLMEAAILGIFGGVAGIMLGCFFALITNTSSTETVVFGMHFGQSSNLSIPFCMALETLGVSTITTLFAGWAVKMRQKEGD